MLYSDTEQEWLNRRAAQIAEERGWPLPIVLSEAGAEVARNRASGYTAGVINIKHVRTLHHARRSRP
jgi:hypothetical protein